MWLIIHPVWVEKHQSDSPIAQSHSPKNKLTCKYPRKLTTEWSGCSGLLAALTSFKKLWLDVRGLFWYFHLLRAGFLVFVVVTFPARLSSSNQSLTFSLDLTVLPQALSRGARRTARSGPDRWPPKRAAHGGCPAAAACESYNCEE
jgi:hypothetical protein